MEKVRVLVGSSRHGDKRLVSLGDMAFIKVGDLPVGVPINLKMKWVHESDIFTVDGESIPANFGMEKPEEGYILGEEEPKS